MHTPTFAGRAGQLAEFTRALRSFAHSPDNRAVLYVHGPAGIGKTALLSRFAAIARAGDRRVVEIDAARSASAEALWGQIREAAAVPGTVLLVDDVDQVGGADGALPPIVPAEVGEALIVVAGQNAPSASWRAAARRRGGLRALRLGPLCDADARALVSGPGTDGDQEISDLVVGFAQGHPLALVLAEAARAEGRFRYGEPPQELVLALLDEVIGDVPSPAHRQALEIAAHSRWTTEDLLRTALSEDGGSAADVFDWLRRRPFAHAQRNGTTLFPLVRDLLDNDLRWRDPSGYRSMHERIRTHLLEQIRQALPHHILPATAALTYLHRHNGFVARFVTWQGGDRFQELPYRQELRDDVLRFVASAEGASTAAETARWLDAQPRAFHVYWDTAAHAPAAVLAWLRPDVAGVDGATTDPLAAAARHHAHTTRPLRPREHLALARVYAPPAAHHAASELMDLVIYRILAGFLLNTPAWSFVATASGSFLDPLMRYIDQRPVRPPVTVQGLSFTLYAHDWRTVTLERWMEVGHLAELAGPAARPAARPRSGPGAFTVLTREEFDSAVGDALAAWQRKDLLAGNPLLRTRLVARQGGDDPVAALRKIITEALDALGSDPRAVKYHRALVTGFLRGAPTREAAAERLGLPLSTFRRHMSRGLERVRSSLWALESAPRATGTDPPSEPPPGTASEV
ncbi:AAA family ATPase [Streptomyces sp. NPDC000345]|uniref:AAA family ATPase n=1 Tax=Streptomyces sp. NPDC000345 TaxID=3364537 RepID=UPI0036BF1884